MSYTNSNFLSSLSPNCNSLIPSSPEAKNLASTYLLQAKLALEKENCHDFAFFEKALLLDPLNPEILYRYGSALLEDALKKNKEKNLLLANQFFKKAISLNPCYFEAWKEWGQSLIALGLSSEENHFFLEAEKKLKQACMLIQDQSLQLIVKVYWDYGIACLQIAHSSQEAFDFFRAIQAFQKSFSLQEPLSSYLWNIVGKAYLNLGELIFDIRFTVKAISCFKRGIACDKSCLESWMSLAKSLHHLYLQTYDEDYFVQLQECMTQAFYLNPHEEELWILWPHFLLESGKQTGDTKKLQLAIEKCQQGYAYHQHQKVLMIWAEALGALGVLLDQIDYISAAQNKLTQLEELGLENDTDYIQSQAECFLSFGDYFQDKDYYYQSIEKFQEALSIDRTLGACWRGMGRVYTKLGLLDEDCDAFEQAAYFYSKSLFYHPNKIVYLEYAHVLGRLGDIKRDSHLLEQSIVFFEYAFEAQKNSLYFQKYWFFYYGISLDHLGSLNDESVYHQKALEIFVQLLILDPDSSHLHYRIALVYNHLGDSLGEMDYFYKSFYHYHLAIKQEEDNDQLLLDWGVTLINGAQHAQSKAVVDRCYGEAEFKIIQSAKLGNEQAFYQLACLYSLLSDHPKALYFLEKAHLSKTLPPIEELLDDEWLEGIRLTPSFQEFLLYLQHG